MMTILILLLASSLVYAQDAYIDPPDGLVVILNGSARLTCSSPSGAHIDSIQWFMNGVLQKSVDLNGDIQIATFDLENVYDMSIIQCLVRFTSGNISSVKVPLYVQGLLPVVGNLTLTVNDSIATLSWTAPFSLDITNNDPAISGYCVDVYRAGSLVHSTCEVTETEFNYLLPPDGLCHVYTFTVTPVNAAGNGTSDNYTRVLSCTDNITANSTTTPYATIYTSTGNNSTHADNTSLLSIVLSVAAVVGTAAAAAAAAAVVVLVIIYRNKLCCKKSSVQDFSPDVTANDPTDSDTKVEDSSSSQTTDPVAVKEKPTRCQVLPRTSSRRELDTDNSTTFEMHTLKEAPSNEVNGSFISPAELPGDQPITNDLDETPGVGTKSTATFHIGDLEENTTHDNSQDLLLNTTSTSADYQVTISPSQTTGEGSSVIMFAKTDTVPRFTDRTGSEQYL